MNKCIWTYCDNQDYDYYETSCDEAHYFTCGDIKANDFRYCPYCGKEIESEEHNEHTERL